MKRGSEYAKKVKRFYNQLVRKFGKPTENDLTDPIEQLVLSILSLCTSATKAQSVYRKVMQSMVDLNELRVTPAMELVQIFGSGFPLAKYKAQCIVDALNAIRQRQDSLDLFFLKQRGRREARDYLESLQGVGRTVAARIMLLSLGGHAIPVDDLALYLLRKEEIIDQDAETAEVQGFLERHISASQAYTFVALLDKYVSARGAKIPINKLHELLAPAPKAVAQVDKPVTTPQAEQEKTKEPASKKVPPSGKAKKKTEDTKNTTKKKKKFANGESARPAKKAKKNKAKAGKQVSRIAKKK